MRFAPTSTLWSAAAVIALALAGCASTDNGDAEAPETIPATNDSTAAPEKKDDTKTGDRPDFAPQFETAPPADDTDPSKDPTPPGSDNQCIDDGDPGATPALAKKLADTDDCNQDLITVSGVMNGGVDTDYYSLSATDKGVSTSHLAGCKLDTTFETKTANTEICVYARCKSTTDNAVTGCIEGKESTSENGWKGCCGAKAIPDLDCSGFTDNDSADFQIRIKQTNNSNKCLPYKFQYRF